MNWLEHILSPAVVRALGWTIVHSLWQGAVVALALAGLLLLLRQHSAQVRYNVAGMALLVTLSLSAGTFGRYYLAVEANTEVAPAARAVASTTTSTTSVGGNLPPVTAFAKRPVPTLGPPLAAVATAGPAWLPYFDQHLPLLVAAWLLGLLAMTLRFLGGLAYLDRLRHYRVRPLSAEWQRHLLALSHRAGLRRTVTLLESALVKAPLVAGHLRPVILLPLGTVSGLSPAHLEAILAHELAHIIRRDYLMNLIQSLTEILFFYHPGIWFVNACLRTERENCCDDRATSLCGSPLTVAQALTKLAELSHNRLSAPRLAVAAVGPDGSLLGRVRRLVSRRTAPSFSEGFLAALVVLGGVLVLGVSTAFSVATPPVQAARNQALAAGNAWRTELLPGLTILPPASVAPLSPVRAEVLVGSAEDEDKDKNNKRRKDKENDRVVIVQEGARGRRAAEAVVLERDKKGRVTELYVNGTRIDAKELDATRQQGKNNGTQVIRLNSGSARTDESATVRFDYEDGGNVTVAGKSWSELREVLPSIAENIDKHRLALALADRNLDRHRLALANSNLSSSARLVDPDRSRSQALRLAEQSLRDAERRANSESEREKIRAQIEDIRQEQEQVRERQQAVRDRTQAERDRQQAERDKAWAARDQLRAERDKARAERDAQVLKAEDAIIAELLKDGLIKDKNQFEFALTANDLYVNERKQPEAVFAKYRKMYEAGVGRTIGASDKMTLSYNGGNVNRIYTSRTTSNTSSSVPAPPPPPAAPLAPEVPRVPAAPTAPSAPPRTPTVNSVDLASQLREDSLIGQNDKSYQFQLNNNSLTVNGKRQSAALADKYRKLLDREGRGNKFNMTISVQE